jgi:hypothetical protein
MPKLATQHQKQFYKRIVQTFAGHARLDPDFPEGKVELNKIPMSSNIVKMDVGLLKLADNAPKKIIETESNKEEWPISKNGFYFGFVNEKEMAAML